MTKYAQITGWGKYIPAKVVTNHDLEQMVDTNDEWIVARTGIRERRMAGPDDTTSTMAVAAARQALATAQLDPADLDLIIVATSSPDYFLPPVSSMIQHALGARRAAAFELTAGCTGFVYGLATGHQFIATGAYQNVLVIGVELITRFVDWEDRNTCVLFGDGAGAVVLQASDTPTGVLSFVLGSDGSGAEHLIVPGGGCRHPFSQEVLDRREHYIRMNGREVFKFATRTMGKAAARAVEASGLTLQDIDLLIPHQANLRIIQLAMRQMKLSPEKVYINVDRYGNTSAASIPIALCEAIEDGRVNDGDNLCLVGFGAGLTWAASVVHWWTSQANLPHPTLWQFVPISQERLVGIRARLQTAGLALSSLASSALLPLYTITGRRKR